MIGDDRWWLIVDGPDMEALYGEKELRDVELAEEEEGGNDAAADTAGNENRSRERIEIGPVV